VKDLDINIPLEQHPGRKKIILFLIQFFWTRPIWKLQAHDMELTSSTFLYVLLPMPEQQNNSQPPTNYHPISTSLRELHLTTFTTQVAPNDLNPLISITLSSIHRNYVFYIFNG
jgi:hypothetical protein